MPMLIQAEKKSTMLKSEATRARILECALAIFRERGFENSTMREIAKAAGVAVGAAYYYFDSKNAIVMAFYQRAQEEMAPSLDTVLSEAKTLAFQVKEDANAMEGFTRMNVSLESHAAAFTR